MDTIQLTIEGMHCGGCANSIQIITEKIEGVESVFIDFDGKTGTWGIDPLMVSPERIIAAILELGYTAVVVE